MFAAEAGGRHTPWLLSRTLAPEMPAGVPRVARAELLPVPCADRDEADPDTDPDPNPARNWLASITVSIAGRGCDSECVLPLPLPLPVPLLLPLLSPPNEAKDSRAAAPAAEVCMDAPKGAPARSDAFTEPRRRNRELDRPTATCLPRTALVLAARRREPSSRAAIAIPAPVAATAPADATATLPSTLPSNAPPTKAPSPPTATWAVASALAAALAVASAVARVRWLPHVCSRRSS
jgi:hypothetical protein